MPEVITLLSERQRNGAAQPVAQETALFPRVLMGFGVAAVASLIMIGLTSCESLEGSPAVQDFGAGVSDATGLKGTLKARWVSTSAEYQLEVGPVQPLENAGFSYVAANPTGPFSLHMKLLDPAGNTLCGKDVLFPFHSSAPGEADRERGQDLLQAKTGEDGKVVSLSAQGNLPCTEEQYKRAVHWDFTTDFPELAVQNRLVKQADARRREEAQERQLAKGKSTSDQEGDGQGSAQSASAADGSDQATRSGFYLEGVERVIKYDASRNVLETKLGASFHVAGPGQQATARLWADDHVLFHYKCDQHSDCVLASAGGDQSLSATALQ